MTTVAAIHPARKKLDAATLIENHFGNGKHGYRFGSDLKVWKAEKVQVVPVHDERPLETDTNKLRLLTTG